MEALLKLRTKAVEAAVIARFAIDHSNHTAVRGRLEHLRRLGTPRGVQTGQGRAAEFGWSELIQVAFAMDLTEIGLSPEHAHRITQDADTNVLTRYANLCFESGLDLTSCVQNGALNEAARNSLMPFSAAAFGTLRFENAEGGSGRSWHSQNAFFDVSSSLIRWLCAIAESQEMRAEAVCKSFLEWAEWHANNPEA